MHTLCIFCGAINSQIIDFNLKVSSLFSRFVRLLARSYVYGEMGTRKPGSWTNTSKCLVLLLLYLQSQPISTHRVHSISLKSHNILDCVKCCVYDNKTERNGEQSRTKQSRTRQNGIQTAANRCSARDTFYVEWSENKNTHTNIGWNVFCMLFHQIKTNKMYQREAKRMNERSNEQRNSKHSNNIYKFVQIGFWCKIYQNIPLSFFPYFCSFPFVCTARFFDCSCCCCCCVLHLYLFAD